MYSLQFKLWPHYMKTIDTGEPKRAMLKLQTSTFTNLEIRITIRKSTHKV